MWNFESMAIALYLTASANPEFWDYHSVLSSALALVGSELIMSYICIFSCFIQDTYAYSIFMTFLFSSMRSSPFCALTYSYWSKLHLERTTKPFMDLYVNHGCILSIELLLEFMPLQWFQIHNLQLLYLHSPNHCLITNYRNYLTCII